MSVAAMLAVAVLVVALLTAGATAVRSVSRIWLRHWAEQGARGADVVSTYLERPHRLILAAGTAIAVTVMLTGVALGRADDVDGWRDGARVVGAAVVLLIAGQLVPRAAARRWASQLVPFVVPPLRLVDLLIGPIASLVRGMVQGRREGADDPEEDETRDVLEDLLREGELEGVSAGDEAAIISGVVQFGDKTVDQVMRGRDEVFAVDASLAPAELAARVATSGYSRVPVYDGSLDAIVGMVHVFDLIKASGGRSIAWRSLAFTTPEAHCNDLLSRMLRGRLHLAIVRDAEGRTVGLVTLEDLLEELVGDIRDEHDEHEDDGDAGSAAPPASRASARVSPSVPPQPLD